MKTNISKFNRLEVVVKSSETELPVSANLMT